MDYNKINFHKFVDEKLSTTGHRIVLITEELMNKRIDDFMTFVNGVLIEYSDAYGWKTENKEYFLNGLVDKWKYSYAIMNEKDEICFMDCTSVYKDILHQHFIFAGSGSRDKNFGKLILIKICQTGLDNGLTRIETWVPKKNNGSIMFHMKMGWHIETIREEKQVLMIVDLAKSRNQTYELVLSGKKYT
jgi:hypothetical protein